MRLDGNHVHTLKSGETCIFDTVSGTAAAAAWGTTTSHATPAALKTHRDGEHDLNEQPEDKLDKVTFGRAGISATVEVPIFRPCDASGLFYLILIHVMFSP